MRTRLLDLQSTIMIDNDQVTIFYDFSTSKLQIYINDKQTTDWYFNPSRLVFNQVTLVTLATEALIRFKKKEQQENKI